jgi:two-component system nitrate/nitrite response regulator NarL
MDLPSFRVSVGEYLKGGAMDHLRVFLVDPNQLFREGLKRLLDDEKYVVAGEAKSLDDALPSILAHRGIDLVVFDCEMPEASDPAGALRAIREALPAVRIVVLTNNATRSMLGRALGWGVDAYLLKDMSPEALTRSLQLAMMGQQVFPTRLTVALLGIDAPAAEKPAAAPHGLSPRENQILRFLVNGASNKLIARELELSEATVKVHVKGLLRKVQASNRTQAAVWALNNGYADERA